MITLASCLTSAPSTLTRVPGDHPRAKARLSITVTRDATLWAWPRLSGFGLLGRFLVGLLVAFVWCLHGVAVRGCRLGFLLTLAVVGRVEA